MPNSTRDLTHRYTVEEVLAFPDDGNQYQLSDGELFVSPAPTLRHQLIVERLHWALSNYLDSLGLRDLLFGCPADISWHNQQLFQPDLLVRDANEQASEWKDVKSLRLVVEVLSPSTALFDRNQKRPAYQRYHVETVWLIDPQVNRVEVWTPSDTAPTIAMSSLQWHYGAEFPSVSIDLARVFE